MARKKGWADDVEQRLRDVRSEIDLRPIVLGDALERSGNSVVDITVTCQELSNRRWPRTLGDNGRAGTRL